MTALPLFVHKKEVFWAAALFLVLLSLSFAHEFYKYKQLNTYSLHVSEANVLNSYKKTNKENKIYEVLKLQTEDITFYTTLWEPKGFQIGDKVRVGIFTKKIGFYDYLKGFFAPLKFIKLEKKASYVPAVEYVMAQHRLNEIKAIYGALYFAKPLPKQIRSRVATWGLAHLVAISGFHLGLLSAILFFLLKPVYKFFQDKFFPYRNANFDLGIIVFILLGCYALFINLPPSLIRAYAMGVVGFLLFHRAIDVLSFKVLSLTILIVIVIFPKLLFSLGFWFSVSGVFYIYLYLHHFMSKSKTLLLLGLNFWVFILMLPVVHSFFELFSWQQIFSPFISILFGIFYPLSLALHVIGFGDAFDKAIELFLAYPIEIYNLQVPIAFFYVYMFLSILAIRFRTLAMVLPLCVFLIFFI